MDFEFFAKLPIEEQNPKASRDNEIINQYFNILTELSNLNLLIKPSGFDAFVDFKNDNFETKQEVDFFLNNCESSFSSFSRQFQTHYLRHYSLYLFQHQLL